MTDLELFNIRTALIRSYLDANGFDGILLSRPDNFAMATGGKRNYVATHTDKGACSLFVTKAGESYYVGNVIEEPRVMSEELDGLPCEALSFNWFEGNAEASVKKAFSGKFASDDGAFGCNVHNELAYIRSLLTPAELEKYRALGKLGAEAMMATLESIEAGMSEAGIAARLMAEGAARRCAVPVCLIAADDRIAAHRHPLPTVNPLVGKKDRETKVGKYVMVVGCFLREGLTVSMTRFKRVGELPPEIERAYDRICAVDTVMQEATEPGKTLGEVFERCQQAYVDCGFSADEWRRHHQGGATGYAGRTCKGSPGEPFPILDEGWSRALKPYGMDVEFGQAFAWNPSAAGVKSEDTFILHPNGAKEIVTLTPTLPQVDLSAVLARDTGAVKSGMMG